MYVKREFEALSCGHCYSIKAKIATYFECVSVALGKQCGMLGRHIVICGLRRSEIFFQVISKWQYFQKKKKFTEHKMFVLNFSTNFV